MTSLPLFDALASEQGKAQGMKAAADSNKKLLEEARGIARRIAYIKGIVTADDVQAELIIRGYPENPLGNAAGSLFPRSEFEFTGNFRQSKRVKGHANLLREWRLRRNQ
jgi:hypothetical protein